MLKTFSIFNRKTKTYQLPTYYESVAQAKYEHARYINSEDGQTEDPEQFTLNFIGTYDEDTGIHEPSSRGPQLICGLEELKEEKVKVEESGNTAQFEITIPKSEEQLKSEIISKDAIDNLNSQARTLPLEREIN